MGTNFYIKGSPKTANLDDPKWHIGKRSAAGLYCFDCGVTLCEQGEKFVHLTHYLVDKDDETKKPLELKYIFTKAPRNDWLDVTWLDQCPICKRKPIDEDITESSAGRELGFNKEPQVLSGIRSCSSFSWAMPRDEVVSRVEEISGVEALKEGSVKHSIVNEYGDPFTLSEFFTIISGCPIQCFNSLGVHFS